MLKYRILQSFYEEAECDTTCSDDEGETRLYTKISQLLSPFSCIIT